MVDLNPSAFPICQDALVPKLCLGTPAEKLCLWIGSNYTPVAELPDESIIYNILNRKE
jgi:hypothetical protein